MHRFHFAVLTIPLLFPLANFLAVEKRVEPPESTPYQQWVGEWTVGTEANRMLGYEDEDSRSDSNVDHPISFSLSLDDNFGDSIGKEALKEFQEEVFKGMEHRVVATGKWETKFEVDPGIMSDCFVTTHKGQSYLWVGAPYIILFGGSVAHVQGIDKRHDMLVLNFSTHIKERTPDTVIYVREKK